MNAPIDVEIRHFHFFCGAGGGAKGFNRGQARVGSLRARFRCIGGIDSDPAAIRDFDRAAGVAGTVRDLFSEEQYRAFHGHAPPPGWREATPDDIRSDAHGERPHIVFLSAPCKGFSGLLAESRSTTAKYQALNGITLRGVWLMLEAWKDDPPELIVFENVPRIASRGRSLLDQIIALLRSYGCAVAETKHDCGEIGGLGQSRKRFLLVARHEAKVPPFLYEPEKHRLKGVGEVLETLPLPGDPRGGPMHRMPSLQWQTWVRLALVEAGSDWRSLNRLAVENGVLHDFGIVPDVEWQAGVLGVRTWGEPSGVVAGRSTPTNGNFSVADPRPENFPSDRGGLLGVGGWRQPAATITSQRSPQQGRFAVADPRLAGKHHGILGVQDWANPSGVVRNGGPMTGRFAVADPRVDGHPRSVQLGVRRWMDTAAVVKGDVSVGTGPYAVADPLLQGRPRFNNVFRIVPWGEASPAVAGPGGPAGGISVADPRPAQRDDYKQTKYRVTGYAEPAGTVISASTTGNGAFAVADPRPARPSVQLHGKFHVTPFDKPARAVIAGRENGAFVVADPRPAGLNGDRAHYVTGGHYGVVPWTATAGAIPAYGKHDRGPWSVADPRQAEGDSVIELPKPKDRLVAVIRALDGTWHRPFTTLELAALQSFVDPDEVCETYALDGSSDSAWRERIGNMVPPAAAEAIAGVMGTTLLLAMSGETFMLSNTPIWVRPLATALAVDQRGNVPAEDWAE